MNIPQEPNMIKNITRTRFSPIDIGWTPRRCRGKIRMIPRSLSRLASRRLKNLILGFCTKFKWFFSHFQLNFNVFKGIYIVLWCSSKFILFLKKYKQHSFVKQDWGHDWKVNIYTSYLWKFNILLRPHLTRTLMSCCHGNTSHITNLKVSW